MKIALQLHGETFLAEADSKNTRIYSSYLVKSRADMRGLLVLLRVKAPDCALVNDIPLKTMIREWRAHNLLYALHIQRERTRDVDLNEESWWRKACYAVLSLMYWRI